MFEDFATPPKGKGKEKDIGRRRAYVRVVTSLGGSLNLELYCEKVSIFACLPHVSDLPHLPASGSKNLLQFPHASQSWEV